MVGWAKENAKSSGLEDAPIRWIVDDCVKFVEREIRRGNHYDAIHPLVKLCAQLLSDKPLFFLINSYTTGLAPAVLTYMLSIEVKSKFGGSVISDEIGLPVAKNGLILPCGASGRWSADE